MANFQVSGIGDVMTSMDELCKIPDRVKADMLKAMGEAAKKAQALEADAEGINDTGDLIKSLFVKKPVLIEDGGNVVVTFKGTRTDESHKTPTRNAEIAFVNEFGKNGQAARPFIKTANEKSADKIVEAGQSVFNRWIDSRK